MHAIFVREHNRIAKSLYKLNPGLSDLTYFQYARQILIAEWQNIVYTEWLPALIGNKYKKLCMGHFLLDTILCCQHKARS